MRKLILFSISALLFAACSSGTSSKSAQDNDTKKPLSVTIKTSNGKYVAINSSDQLLQGIESDPSKAVVFEIIEQAGGKIAIKANNGKYVISDLNSEGKLYAKSDKIGPWETFEIVPVDKTHINLKTSTVKFVCADQGYNSHLIGNRDNAAEWEQFVLDLK